MDAPARLFKGADQPEYRALQPALGPGGPAARDDRARVSEAELCRTPFYRLRLFHNEAAADRPPVLIVPPLSGHFPLLLRDMVLGLLPHAPVALLDWANVRHVSVAEGSFGFDDNIAAIRAAILRLGPSVSAIALCQAGVPALAAVADLAAMQPGEAPASLSLIAAPIDPLANPTPVVELIRGRSRHWYDIVPVATVPPGAAGRGRWVYPARAQLAALRLYLERQLRDDTELARKIAHDDGADPARFPFLDLYTSIMDIDARHFAENIDTVFLRRLLPRGELAFENRPIDLTKIRDTALTTVEGALDDIAAPGQTAAAHTLCAALPGRDHHRLVVPQAGHFALFHGEIWRHEVLPFLRAHALRATPP